MRHFAFVTSTYKGSMLASLLQITSIRPADASASFLCERAFTSLNATSGRSTISGHSTAMSRRCFGVTHLEPG